MRNFASVVKLWLFKVNILVFILISLTMTIVCEKIPDKIYSYRKWLFRERKWENGGRIYEHYFGVKSWKAKLPDISDFFKWRFNKKHLAGSGSDYLSTFLMESCKSEFTHWMIIVSTVFFNFWNDIIATAAVFLFACLLNLPYIIIQRYNRPRLIKLMLKNNINEYELSAAKI